MSETDARALANQIAKILDREGVKPPLRLQAWDAIHNAIEAFIRAEREAAHAAGHAAGVREERERAIEIADGYCNDFHREAMAAAIRGQP